MSEKLNALAMVKHEFILEDYVLSMPLDIRVIFSKLRTSTHALEIEVGRYKKIVLPNSSKPVKIPRELRVCTLCDANEVESELHFLMTCPYYDKPRDLFFEQASITSPNLLSMETTSKFEFILSCGNGDRNISKLICDFVNEIYALRNAFLSVSLPDPHDTSQVGPTSTRSSRLSMAPVRFPN